MILFSAYHDIKLIKLEKATTSCPLITSISSKMLFV